MHLRASPIPSVRSLGYRSPAQALAVCVFIFALLSSFILWWRTSGGGHAVESSSGSAQDWPSPCDIRRATVHPVTPYNISTALASYPRSGNTWLRTLVEKATGHLTSSLYCDRHLRRTFRSECDKTNRWLVKTHYPVTSLRRFPDPQSHFRRFDRVIHVVRNPFDAIVSYHHFHKTANHTGRADPQRFRIDADKLHWYIRKYRSHYTYWTNVPLHKLLVRYEDLRADPATELRRVVHFLGDSPEMASALLQEASAGQGMVKRASLVNDTLIRCAIADGRTAYNTQAPQRQHLFGIDMLGEEAVETILRELAPVICQLGYHELFPRWLKEKLAEVDGDRGSSAGEEIVTAERARLDRLQRYVAAGVDCAALETVVDFDPTRVSGAKAEGMRG